jgi:hypothetical protein
MGWIIMEMKWDETWLLLPQPDAFIMLPELLVNAFYPELQAGCDTG